MFNLLRIPPDDPLHGVMARFAADTRTDKIDLGVGVYRDETGRAPIIGAVAAAEAEVVRRQTTKAYQGLRGDEVFLEHMQTLIFGNDEGDRVASLQCVGGTGGIHLALSLTALINRDANVLIGIPTWPNHTAICEHVGLNVVAFDYFDKQAQTLRPENLWRAIREAVPGDLLILHGPCHNPTGADLSPEQFAHTLELAADRGVVPLIDAAYCGLANTIESDFAVLRQCVARFPEAFLVVSCSKIFSLYRERTGVLFVASNDPAAARRALATLERLARATYSMPPAHGAAVVAHVLGTAALRSAWAGEVDQMRRRLLDVRKRLMSLAESLPALAHITMQNGIFSLLPIGADIVEEMARTHAIYMPQSGRINIAGFKAGDERKFVSALRASLDKAKHA